MSKKNILLFIMLFIANVVYSGSSYVGEKVTISTTQGCVNGETQIVVKTVDVGKDASDISYTVSVTPGLQVKKYGGTYGQSATGTASKTVGNSNTFYIKATNSGQYTVTFSSADDDLYFGTTDNQDDYRKALGITYNASAPTPSISGTTTICKGSITTLTASGGGTYSWSSGGTSAANAVSPTSTTDYTVTVTKDGCTAATSQRVTVNALPIPTISGTTTICNGASTTLTAGGGTQYDWGSGYSTTATNNVSPTTTTSYTVSVKDANGCTATKAQTVTVNVPTISNVSNYDFIWRGGADGNANNWNTASNWYVYDGSTYSVATELPTTEKNVYIGASTCIANVAPEQSGEANVKNLTIASGATLTVPASKTLNIKGNLSNAGTLSANNASKVVFNGSADQTISNAVTFGNVTFNQSAANKINAANGITVNGTATFTSGVVSGNVTFGEGGSSVGANLNSYVDGTVTKSGNANGFTFPTGDNGNLGTVAVTTDANNVSVQYFGKSTGFGVSELPRWWNVADMCGDNPFNHISNMEYWKISSSTEMTANFNAQAASDMHFNDNTGNRNPANINMAFYGSNCWRNVGGTATVDGNTIKIEGAVIPASTRDISGNYSTFGSTNENTLLPIELVSFTATCDGRSSLVEWTTATEKNNDYFSLERSDDAVNFTEIARVAGAGNSIEPIDYSYTDYGIHGGDNYYRIVQVDYDGTRTVSEIVVANCIEASGEPEVLAYPNPFSNDLTVVLDNFGNRAATIEVYDMLGKLIYTNKVAAPQNSYETILNLSNLPPAAYTVRVSTADFVINRNVVKQ